MPIVQTDHGSSGMPTSGVSNKGGKADDGAQPAHARGPGANSDDKGKDGAGRGRDSGD